MKRQIFTKVLSVFLCLCAILPSVAWQTAATEPEASVSEAVDINAPGTAYRTLSMPNGERTVWTKDYSAVTSTTAETQTFTAKDGTSYSGRISVSGGTLKKGVGLSVSGGTMYALVTETVPANSFFQKYDDGCILINAVVNFTEFPQIISASYKNPLSLITWTSKVSSSHYLRFFCLDSEGYLCNNERQRVSEKARLTAGVDAALTIVAKVDGKTCTYDAYMNGEYLFTGVDNSIPTGTLTSSTLRFFDSQCKYSACLKSFSVQTVNADYERGVTSTANWTAYQTTPVAQDKNGREVFDLRLISLLNSRAHAAVGYEVTAVYRDTDGTNKTKHYDDTTDTVFTSLSQTVDGKLAEWNAEDNGGKYIHAMTVEGIYADLDGMELRVRPYSLDYVGNKVYGEACFLSYRGKGTDGYPKFVMYDSPYEGEFASVTEDTYVRFGKYATDVYEGSTYLECKHDSNADYNRAVFFKFDISQLPQSFRYEFSLRFQAGPGEGTMKLTAVDPSFWDAGSLTAQDVKSSWNMGWSTTFPYAGAPFVDITEYISEAIENGQDTVSFRLDFVEKFTSAAKIYAAESGSRAAKIYADRSYFHYNVNLNTAENMGYDPWNYAENIVSNWADNIEAIYAKPHTSTIADSDKSAADYTKTLAVSSNSSPTSAWNTIQARTVETVNGYTPISDVALDAYGGLASDNGKYYSGSYGDSVNGAKGYFGTYYDSARDRWWFITPEGNRFIAVGICTVNAGSGKGQKALAEKVYAQAGQTWQEWTSDLLNQYGINATSGSISAVYDESELAEGKYNINTHVGISLIGQYGAELGTNSSVGGSTVFSNNNTVNVFDPDFVEYAYERAQIKMAEHLYDPNRMGWTSDNEIPADSDMLDRYLTLDPSNPVNAFSYAAAWTWLRHITGDPNPSIDMVSRGTVTMNMGGEEKEVSYRDLFRGFVYYRYYAISSGAIKTAAPHQLYLGCRELQNNYLCETVMRVAGHFCDVVTLNLYLGADPDASVMANLHKWAGKPFYVTEFYAKAMGTDASGNPSGMQSYAVWEYQDAEGNTQYCLADGKTQYVDADGNTQTAPELVLNNTRGAGRVVYTQEDRATYYQTFAIKMLESGYCVGWSWYRYQDNEMTIYLKDGEYVENTWPLQQKANAGTLGSDYVVVHQGEIDQSNLDSNKGIVNSAMEVYVEFAEGIGELSKNKYALADFLDADRR